MTVGHDLGAAEEGIEEVFGPAWFDEGRQVTPESLARLARFDRDLEACFARSAMSGRR